jgi:arylsulfatase A-like enzyme
MTKLAVPAMVAFIFFISSSYKPEHVAARRPNIILIIADDLGFSDLASYGNTRVHTPNIDNLGNEGVRFTSAYVTSPICSPSRMGIMTGRYQNRFGSEFMPYDNFSPELIKKIRSHFMPFHKKTEGIKSMHPALLLNRKKYQTGLDKYEINLGQLLKQNGYATGFVGKWNLGDVPGNHPYERGFDYGYYFSGALTRYVDDPIDTSRYVNVHLPWSFSEFPAWAPRSGSSAIYEDKEMVKDTGYLTFSFAKKAIDFIDKNKANPFFLVLSFNAVHDPFQAPKEYFDRIQTEKDSVKRVYLAMTEALDDAVGSVMQKLKSSGLDENTVILFVSDNGGATYTRATDNWPLKGGKCTHFDGGLRVPFFIKYPDTVQGGQLYHKAVSSLDIFSTIAAVARVSLPTDRIYDGVNLVPFVTDTSRTPHEIFYWRNGYSKAIRRGDWKLYINEKNHRMFLYDVAADESEKYDRSAEQPALVKELKKELEHWEKTQTVKPAWPSISDVSINVDGVIYSFPS